MVLTVKTLNAIPEYGSIKHLAAANVKLADWLATAPIAEIDRLYSWFTQMYNWFRESNVDIPLMLWGLNIAHNVYPFIPYGRTLYRGFVDRSDTPYRIKQQVRLAVSPRPLHGWTTDIHTLMQELMVQGDYNYNVIVSSKDPKLQQIATCHYVAQFTMHCKKIAHRMKTKDEQRRLALIDLSSLRFDFHGYKNEREIICLAHASKIRGTVEYCKARIDRLKQERKYEVKV